MCIQVFKGGSTGFVPLYVYDAQTYHSKSSHVAEKIAGSMPDNKNGKSPHVAEEIGGWIPDNKNSKSPHPAEEISGSMNAHDIKTEWFFHESRSGTHQQWAEDRKTTRPNLRDPD